MTEFLKITLESSPIIASVCLFAYMLNLKIKHLEEGQKEMKEDIRELKKDIKQIWACMPGKVIK